MKKLLALVLVLYAGGAAAYTIRMRNIDADKSYRVLIKLAGTAPKEVFVSAGQNVDQKIGGWCLVGYEIYDMSPEVLKTYATGKYIQYISDRKCGSRTLIFEGGQARKE